MSAAGTPSHAAPSPAGSPRGGGEHPWKRAVFRNLKSLDIFARMLKIQSDLQTPTVSGGLLSLAAALLILLLVATETSSYLTKDRVQTLSVDPGRNEKLRIHFDIDLNYINCDIVGVDALDGTGNTQLEIANHMFKTRIDHEGKAIKDGERAPLQRVMRAARDGAAGIGGAGIGAAASAGGAAPAPAASGDPSPSPSPVDIGGTPGCGSCMGAGDRVDSCCNSCADVQKAYEERGWLLIDLSGVPQCIREGRTHLTPGEFNAAEGCNVHGFVEVLKVAGTIHIAPGHSFNFHGRTLHDLSALRQVMKDKKLNLSHRVKSLSFGAPFPGGVNPLDGSEKKVGATAAEVGQYQYFAQVVPTSYKSGSKVLDTNQFSVTESFKPADGQLLPGVFVYYNLSPIKIEVEENRRSFFHFLVQLSAIVGGVFSLASMVDAGTFHTVKAMRKRARAPFGKLN